METSIFLARLIGISYLVMAVSMLLNRARFLAMVDEVADTPFLILLAGMMSLLAGLAIILTHNIWTSDWRVVITLFGWLVFIAGIFRIVFPDRAIALGRSMVKSDIAMTAALIFSFLLGGWLSYQGFFV